MSDLPDLDDPATRALYRRQLAAMARPLRAMAFVVAAVGIGLALVPGVPKVVPLCVIALAVLQKVTAIAFRLGIGPKPRRPR